MARFAQAGMMVLLFVPAALLPAGCGGSKTGLDPKAEGDLRQLGMMYHSYIDGHGGRGPAKFEDFQPLAQDKVSKDALEGLRAGKYVFIWKVKVLDVAKTPAKTEGTILAYEKGVPTGLGHVLMVDGTVKSMSADEFKKTPQAKGE
jgi:hypothetical protein